MKIKAYLKPHCGWSRGIRAALNKYSLAFEELDIVNNSSNYVEMIEKSGQKSSPCVEIDGIMLADISGEELNEYLIKNKLVEPNDIVPDAPLAQGCTHEEHLARKPKTKILRFF